MLRAKESDRVRQLVAVEEVVSRAPPAGLRALPAGVATVQAHLEAVRLVLALEVALGAGVVSGIEVERQTI